ncbi:MAG: YdjY domain-containing protein [Verrucomicrobiales bacterium]|nr:YdjY domain-containing protein [Verrucomicrobiales bacterium]
MFPLRQSFIAPLLACACLSVKGEESVSTAPRPAVTRIGEHQYRLGEIEIDSRKREISFPVVVNMREGGPLEYVLVHEHGKVHESIFTTVISPLQLQVALKLVKYQSGFGDVFNLLLAPEVLEKEGGTIADRGDAIEFSFIAEGKAEPVPVFDFVLDGLTSTAMKGAPWIYTGSKIEDGTFMAEAEGSIIAIYLDHLAIFNMTIEGADTDERWGANSKMIPEIGTAGKLIIAPAQN